MSIGKKRSKQLASKRQRKVQEMKAGGKSQYARKKEYLATHNIGFGFQVPEPKPWK